MESTEQAQDSTYFTSCCHSCGASWGTLSLQLPHDSAQGPQKGCHTLNQPCPTASWHWQKCSLRQGGTTDCSHTSAVLDAPRWIRLLLPLPVSSLETSCCWEAAIPSGEVCRQDCESGPALSCPGVGLTLPVLLQCNSESQKGVEKQQFLRGREVIG